MSRVEFERWAEYYRAHPFDDLHRFHRPAALIAGRNGADVQSALDYLHPPRLPDGLDAAALATMRALGVIGPE